MASFTQDTNSQPTELSPDEVENVSGGLIMILFGVYMVIRAGNTHRNRQYEFKMREAPVMPPHLVYSNGALNSRHRKFGRLS